MKSSAHILDTVASYLYFNQYKNTEVISNIKRILVAQPNFWDVVMTSVLDAFIFGPLLRVIFSRHPDAQLIEGRADLDLEVHREYVLKAVVVV